MISTSAAMRDRWVLLKRCSNWQASRGQSRLSGPPVTGDVATPEYSNVVALWSTSPNFSVRMRSCSCLTARLPASTNVRPASKRPPPSAAAFLFQRLPVGPSVPRIVAAAVGSQPDTEAVALARLGRSSGPEADHFHQLPMYLLSSRSIINAMNCNVRGAVTVDESITTTIALLSLDPFR
jgi:hypothetical protein